MIGLQEADVQVVHGVERGRHDRIRDRAQLRRQADPVVQLVEVVELVLDELDDVGQLGRERGDLLDQWRDRDREGNRDDRDGDRIHQQDGQPAGHPDPGEALDERVEEVGQEQADDERTDGRAGREQDDEDHDRRGDDNRHPQGRGPEAGVGGRPGGGARIHARRGRERAGVVLHRRSD